MHGSIYSILCNALQMARQISCPSDEVNYKIQHGQTRREAMNIYPLRFAPPWYGGKGAAFTPMRLDKWKTPRGRREMGCKRKRRCDVVVKLLVGPFYVLICSQLLRRSSHPEPRGLGRYSRRPRSDRREPGAEWAADPGRGEIQ